MYKRILSLGILTLIASVTLTFGAPNQPAAAAETGGSISGTVYFDTDMDGERDAGEEPAPGRKIELLQYLNESPWELTLDTDVSDRHGAYTLNGVLPGAQYVVSLHLDADTPCWNRESFNFPFDNGTIDTDFGVLEKGSGSISGSLFNDSDEDGALDLDEPGYEGWSVQLDADLNSGTMFCSFSDLTDYSGRYGFTDLPRLPYRVNYWPESSLPFEITSPIERIDSAAGPHSPLVDLRDKEHVSEINILAHFLDGSSVINGIAFRDINVNGFRDEGELALNCNVYRDLIAVYRKTPVGTLIINNAYPSCEDAEFTLSGVAAGDYVVQFYSWCAGPNAPMPSGREGPARSVTVAEGQHAQPVEINMCPQAQAWFPGPEPTPAPTPTVTIVTMPDVGTGPEVDSSSRNVALAAIALLAAAGASGLAFALRRRARRL